MMVIIIAGLYLYIVQQFLMSYCQFLDIFYIN